MAKSDLVSSRVSPDVVFGGLLLLVGASGFVYTISAPWMTGRAGEIGAGLFPAVAFVVLGVSGIAIALTSGRVPASEQINRDYLSIGLLRLLAVIVGSTTYLFAVRELGLWVSTVAYLAAFLLSLLEPKPRGAPRRWPQVALLLFLAFVLSTGIYLLAHNVIGIYLPRQRFF